MIENPTIRPEGADALIVDRRQKTDGQRLRFWGGVLMGGTAVMVMLVPSWRKFDEPMDMIIPLATFAIGALMMMIAGRTKHEEVVLTRLSPAEGRVHVYPEAASVMEGEGRTLWADEVEEVLFGMTRFPMDPTRPEVTVEAFTVCLQLFDGSVLPLVEATPDKKLAFDIAQAVGAMLGSPVQTTGLGV